MSKYTNPLDNLFGDLGLDESGKNSARKLAEQREQGARDAVFVALSDDFLNALIEKNPALGAQRDTFEKMRTQAADQIVGELTGQKMNTRQFGKVSEIGNLVNGNPEALRDKIFAVIEKLLMHSDFVEAYKQWKADMESVVVDDLDEVTDAALEGIIVEKKAPTVSVKHKESPDKGNVFGNKSGADIIDAELSEQHKEDPIISLAQEIFGDDGERYVEVVRTKLIPSYEEALKPVYDDLEYTSEARLTAAKRVDFLKGLKGFLRSELPNADHARAEELFDQIIEEHLASSI